MNSRLGGCWFRLGRVAAGLGVIPAHSVCHPGVGFSQYWPRVDPGRVRSSRLQELLLDEQIGRPIAAEAVVLENWKKG